MQNPLNRVSALALLTALAVPALADWNTSDYGVRTRVDASQYDYGTFGDEVFGITPNGGDHQTSYMDQAGCPTPRP